MLMGRLLCVRAEGICDLVDMRMGMLGNLFGSEVYGLLLVFISSSLSDKSLVLSVWE